MAVFKNPLNKDNMLIVDYGSDSFIYHNSLSKKKSVHENRTDLLTQNSWNFCTRTKKDYYKDVEVKASKIVGRIEASNFPKR